MGRKKSCVLLTPEQAGLVRGLSTDGTVAGGLRAALAQGQALARLEEETEQVQAQVEGELLRFKVENKTLADRNQAQVAERKALDDALVALKVEKQGVEHSLEGTVHDHHAALRRVSELTEQNQRQGQALREAVRDRVCAQRIAWLLAGGSVFLLTALLLEIMV